MRHISWNKLFHLGGLGIGIIGVAFVAWKLYEYSDQINFQGFSYTQFFFLLLLIVVYCFANLLLAFAWRDILAHLGVSIDQRWAIQTYGISQIAKYVPGNIFHFAGRQAIGQTANLPPIPLAKSSVWEIGMLVISGGFFSVLVIPFYLVQFNYLQVSTLFILTLAASFLVLFYTVGAKIASAMKWHILFLLISGLIFDCVLFLFTSVNLELNSIFIGITGVYVIAWLAGLVTPGAPAGVGVREMVFIAILHPVMSEGELLKAIILGRFVTVTGDVLFYIFSIMLRFSNKGSNRCVI